MPLYAIAVLYAVEAPDPTTAWEDFTSGHAVNPREELYATSPHELTAEQRDDPDFHAGLSYGGMPLPVADES